MDVELDQNKISEQTDWLNHNDPALIESNKDDSL